MKTTLLLVLLILSILTIPTLQGQESLQRIYRIHVKDFSRIRTIESKGVTVIGTQPGQYVEILALPEQIRDLGIEGAEVEFVANSFKERYQDYPDLKSSPFHNYQRTQEELIAIAAAHPDITRLDTIGHSLEGRAICSLKISDNPAADEDEPPILIPGAHHGNEVHSIEATLHQINYLVDQYGTDPEVTRWIDSMEIWFVPLVNPDGREAMRRTNNNGVDLNRNYSFGFTPGGGHGPAPFSEPETRAIRDLAARFPPIMSLSYHTSGQYVLYSWTHTDQAAPDSAAMIYHGNLISESITYLNGTRTEHYALRQGGRWYFTAGEYCDYLYVTHNTLAFTVEMGISQAPDYTVVPDMIARNLEGMKTMLRQVGRAGVTGIVTDAVTGLPVRAAIDIPSVDKQGKIPVRLTDSLFGRYYRYLEPGKYTFQVSAPGYRTLEQEIAISPDSLTHWMIRMERAAALSVGKVLLADRRSAITSGNGDGFINLGETIGLVLTLSNDQPLGAEGVYARIGSVSPYARILADSLYFGAMGGNSTKTSPDTVLFRVDPGCPDGEELIFSISIGDTGGPGWFGQSTFSVHAPELQIARIRIDDSGGNGNGAFENGETVTIALTVANSGRQGIHGISAELSTADPYFQVIDGGDETAELQAGNEQTFLFASSLPLNVPKAYVADFLLDISSEEGYSAAFTFPVSNIFGFIDDFDQGDRGWVHNTYGTSANSHDDWQTGTPAGKGGDPGMAASGNISWGTDMGWDSYKGTSWDGLYQANVYNYLSSPVIDCSGLEGTGLKFMRWLNIRISDHARVKVNGRVVWDNRGAGIADTIWTPQIIDISDIADHNSAVVVTFELESNSSGTAGGWNIDDVIVAHGLTSGATSAEPVLADGKVMLFDPRPNPFTDQTTIRYRLPEAGLVDLAVCDLSGRRVRSLFSGSRPAGEQEYTWDGTRDDGRPLLSGIYLCRLETAGSVITRRILLIR